MLNEALRLIITLMFYIILFLSGLGFGSFLNVVSLRYKPEQKLFDLKIIGGRSRCPHCKKQLRWFELVPILSFLFQKGKCRHCEHKLSWQYPIVEILSALIFVFVPLRFATYGLQFTTYDSKMLLVVGCWLLVFLLLLLLAIIDFRHYIIPDEINILLAVLGIILIQLTTYNLQFTTSFIGHYSLLFGSLGNIWVNHISAAVLAMAFFGLIIGISRGRGMGVGDLKLGGALGLIFGWPNILFVLALSFIVGAAIGIILMLKKTKTMKDIVPFGPFLVIGSALVFFFGFQIVNLYFKFFGLYF